MIDLKESGWHERSLAILPGLWVSTWRNKLTEVVRFGWTKKHAQKRSERIVREIEDNRRNFLK